MKNYKLAVKMFLRFEIDRKKSKQILKNIGFCKESKEIN